MKTFPGSLTLSDGCQGCKNTRELDLEFSFAFQPIVDVRDQSIFAHEALVRGINGEGARSVLEKVNDNNLYRFDQLCRMRAIFTAAQLGMTQNLSINFLPGAVYRPEMCIRSTLDAARTHGFPISRLIFETVESEYIDNNHHLTNILRQYREFGFQTAIDDFGSGYSGLKLLADFQPDLIKLDMELVRNIHRDRSRQAILRGVVVICAELDIKIIAEGVEHAEERDFLADCGVYLMQGFWFARPAFQKMAQIAPDAWQKA